MTGDRIQKNPHSIEAKDGKYTIVANLKIVDGFPNTTAAMSEVATAEARDNFTREKGDGDDYTASFEKLMTALDCFIQEYGKRQPRRSGGKMKQIAKGIGSALSPEDGDIEFTLKLLWSFRHICFHAAKCVSEEDSKRYSAMMEKGKRLGRHMLVALPEKLEIGKSISIPHSLYREAKTCLFAFIEKKGLPKGDVQTLKSRSSIANVSLDLNALMGVVHLGLVYFMRCKDLKAANVDFDWEANTIDLPENVIHQDEKSIIFVKSGISIPIVLIEPISKDDKTGWTMKFKNRQRQYILFKV